MIATVSNLKQYMGKLTIVRRLLDGLARLPVPSIFPPRLQPVAVPVRTDE